MPLFLVMREAYQLLGACSHSCTQEKKIWSQGMGNASSFPKGCQSAFGFNWQYILVIFIKVQNKTTFIERRKGEEAESPQVSIYQSLI